MLLEVFPTRVDAEAAVAATLSSAVARTLSRGQGAAIALSGGRTPEPVYRRLAEASLPWAEVTVLLVDERFVPPTDPLSNEGLLRRALGSAARIAPLFHDGRDLAHSAAAADAAYRAAAASLAAVLLGMGEDGHVASWFKGGEGLEAALNPHGTAHVVPIVAPRGSAAEPCLRRLTLTRPALATAETACLLMFGSEKRRVLEAAIAGADLPVAVALEALGPRLTVFWAP